MHMAGHLVLGNAGCAYNAHKHLGPEKTTAEYVKCDNRSKSDCHDHVGLEVNNRSLGDPHTVTNHPPRQRPGAQKVREDRHKYLNGMSDEVKSELVESAVFVGGRAPAPLTNAYADEH
eukprot:GHVN01091252.1.p2 GENE.GHVN01091252.1~~GHVN01091252.1.p2  ORF type:complete len:118 (-),score=3.03 GHVN01091252.1:713-1066(-)